MSSTHLGLDLGGTNIKVATLARTDSGFEVLTTHSIETSAADGPESVAANLIGAGKEVAANVDFETLGLGVPGHFEPDTGRVRLFPNLPGRWKGFPLRDRVGESLGVPTWMINDARAFTLAEGLLGAGMGCTTVVCVTLGTGVGGGIMIDGKLHRGAFGVAGEIGHQIIVPDGPVCGCGNRGCVEAMTRADVLASLAGQKTASEVFEAAKTGDAKSLDAIQEVADFLGIALANMVTLIGPDRIVVGGGIAEAGDLLLDPIESALKARVTLVPTEKIEIVPAMYGRFSGAVGAALAGVVRS